MIAAEHARAARAEDTDWERIAGAYDRLYAIDPSPVIALNRAVAVAEWRGPAAGLALADELAEALDALPPLPRDEGRPPAPARPRGARRAPPTSARSSSRRVPVERAFLRERLAELERTAGR